jgi:uncharacterized protein with PQ loop repeat
MFKQSQIKSDTLSFEMRQLLGEHLQESDLKELDIGANLSEMQKKAFELFKNGKSLFVLGEGGSGKCLKKGTEIIKYDGKIIKVENIKVGDYLMGDDSTSRKVLSLTNGKDIMYKVTNVKGESYTVNSHHILSLIYSNKKNLQNRKTRSSYQVKWFNKSKLCLESKSFSYKNNNKKIIKQEADKFFNNINEDLKIDISIKEFINLKSCIKRDLKGYSVSLNFQNKQLDFDPYILGLWLGDGTSSSTGITNQDSSIIKYLKENLGKYKCYLSYTQSTNYGYNICSTQKRNNYLSESTNYFKQILIDNNLLNNKHIPIDYKCNSRKNRLQLLAGLIDSDGNFKNNGFEFSQSLKHEKLIDDVIYLCRSLGFSCYKNIKNTSWTHLGVKKYGKAWRICISGKGLEEIPTLCPRKKATPRKQIKDVLVSGIKIEELKEDYYYGFELDGNSRFVMGNFIVTHNSSLIKTMQEYNQENIKKNMYITATTGIASYNISGMTINSFMGVGTGEQNIAYLIRRVFRNKAIVNRIQQTDILVIDEISMLSASLFEKINSICQHYRKNKSFMGGIQVIFTGDLMQLLCVFNQNPERFSEPEDTRLIIESDIFNKHFNKKSNNIIILNKNFRQLHDTTFIDLLLRIRVGTHNLEDITILKNKCKNFDIELKKISDKKITPVHLVATNKKCQIINDTNLQKLKGPEFVYKADFNNMGENKECIDILVKELQNQFKQKGLIELRLKNNARVMLIKNLDVELGFINGAMGTITNLNKDSVDILFDNGQFKKLTKVDFELEMNNNIVRGKQIPLILSYSLSIHKCQSLTLDYAIMELSDCFCQHQVYVALSRVKTFDGLLLKSFNYEKIMINKKMKNYIESL